MKEERTHRKENSPSSIHSRTLGAAEATLSSLSVLGPLGLVLMRRKPVKCKDEMSSRQQNQAHTPLAHGSRLSATVTLFNADHTTSQQGSATPNAACEQRGQAGALSAAKVVSTGSVPRTFRLAATALAARSYHATSVNSEPLIPHSSCWSCLRCGKCQKCGKENVSHPCRSAPTRPEE